MWGAAPRQVWDRITRLSYWETWFTAIIMSEKILKKVYIIQK